MAFIKKVIDDLTGASQEEQEIKERLELLKNAAQAHLTIQADTIAAKLHGDGGGISDLYIIPDTVQQAQFGYTVSAGDQLDDGISNAIDLFFKGTKEDVKEGFHQLVKSALQIFFADTTAGEQTKDIYLITMEHNVFVRLDISIWKYRFAQKSISDKVDQAFSYTFVRSIIDHTKVSLDTMIYLISEAMGDDIDKVKTYINQMKDLYSELKDDKNPAATAKKAIAMMK